MDGEGGADPRLVSGGAALGIELGSTRIKACLVGESPSDVLAIGSHHWESTLEDGVWTYSLEAVWAGVAEAFADLQRDAQRRHGARVRDLRAIGVSGMMHGYLAFDEAAALLVPFRTWRNGSTAQAAAELTELLGAPIPLRWSVAHHRQAMLDQEPHVERVAFLTTLAGYVHWQLTGQKVLGVGDASGMFPIDPCTGRWDRQRIAAFDAVTGGRFEELLPRVLPAGAHAGRLTTRGARLLDPTGEVAAGAVACPPEGDAGTGMVATCAIAPRTGNVSVGTSAFAMVVLERPLAAVHEAIDIVMTPAGDTAAMVHCNNGASEMAAWAAVFAEFAAAAGAPMNADEVFETVLGEALTGDTDAGGVVAYNQIAGEPIAGLSAGRPLVVRTPESRLTLANLMRAQTFGVFANLALGMRVLAEEHVEVDALFAHGGVFRTAGVAQSLLAAALDVPVSVATTASEGGAWGIAALAAFAADAPGVPLDVYLRTRVFHDTAFETVAPVEEDAAGFAAYLDRYVRGLAVVRTAAVAV